MKKLSIFGSTGSIGSCVLSIVSMHLNLFKIIALVSKGQRIDLLANQCKKFNPKFVGVHNAASADILKCKLKQLNVQTKIVFGSKSLQDLATLEEVDYFISAIPGIAGMLPTVEAVQSGKIILLANKEILAACGKILIDKLTVHKSRILPIDSEQSAIFQMLPKSAQRNLGSLCLKNYGIKKIIITGSGGPLRNINKKDLRLITPNQACNHPNWVMGKKISVDSATMMNKGLEYIGCKWLFNANEKQLEIILHPQSIVHAMIIYIDENVEAIMSDHDMRIPITNILAWPNRIYYRAATEFDISSISNLTFDKPDYNKYQCLKLAIDACKAGQAATTILNASNEIAVQAFLEKKILFTDIAKLISIVLNKLSIQDPSNIDEVLYVDTLARKIAINVIKQSLN